MNKLIPILFVVITSGGCTEIRKPPNPVSETSASSGSTPSSGTFQALIPKASKAVATSNGYVTLGCSQPTLSNFCFSVLGSTGTLIKEVSDLPKITLATGGYTVAHAIAFLPPNDVIIVGSTTGNLGEVQGGNGDGFVARYSLDGFRIWIKQFGQNTLGLNSNQRDDFFDVAPDTAGNIYVSGRTRSNFGNSGALNSRNFDALLLKLNGSGVLLWSKLDGSPYDEEYHRVLVSAQGHVVVGGQTCGNLFETNAGSATDPTYNSSLPCPNEKFQDVMMSSYLTDGTLRYHRQIGKISLPTGKGVASDQLMDIASSSTGELYFTGGTSSAFGVGGADPAMSSETNAGFMDIYLGKLNSSGALQWIRMWGAGTSGTSKSEFGKKILVKDDTSEVLLCSETYGNFLEAQGGGAIGTAIGSSGKGDLVLSKLSTSGGLLLQTHYGNLTLGAARSGQKETCGSLIRNQNSIILFGTSNSTLFSGTGPGFMAWGEISNFVNLLK